MSTEQVTVSPAVQTGQTVELSQQPLAWFTNGCERFVERLMKGTIGQIEVTESLIAGDLADWDLLIRADTPAAFVDAEFKVFRRRTDQVAEATLRIMEEMSKTWIRIFT